VAGVQEIVAGIIETLRHDTTPFLALAPLRSMDEYTFTHSINVCVLNLSQAMGVQVEGQLLADIGIAALLHDIGKLFIPVEVINKPGKLDEAEWALMKQHPVKGAEYLVAAPDITKLAAVTAFEHHMKFNNFGYPKAPQGWKQNLCSQMTTISDIFDAMRTRRSYRKSMETREVISLMQGITGTELHPALMKNFLKILGRFSWSKGVEVSKNAT
jgi:HD-GYP domain-containing protein (c-di-GMP phosphodiesterase class II)